MGRTALLALVFLAGVAVCSATPAFRWIRFSSEGDDPEPSCLTYTDKDSCLDHACGWCSSSVLGDLKGCVSESIVKLIPDALAECKLPKSDDDADDDDDDDVYVHTFFAQDGADPDKPKPKKPTSCGDNKEKHDCLDGAEEGDCAWCEGDFMPASCVGVKAAEWIPTQVAKCKMPKKHKKHDDDDKDDDDSPALRADPDKPKPKKPTSCGDNKEKHDCLDGAEEGDCAWCEGDFMPASCVGVKAAEWIPTQVAKCKMPKKHKKHDDDDKDDDDTADVIDAVIDDVIDLLEGKHGKKKKQQAASCDDIKDSKQCVKDGAEEGECAWCEGKYMPAGCMSTMKAKYLPEMVAKCKLPKKHDSDDAGIFTGVNKQKGKGGSGYGPGGGDYPGGGGDYPGGGGQGQGCMGLKSKKKCLKGTDTEACAWCGKSSMLGSPCVSESVAKYLPAMVAKCKIGKGPKKHDETDKVATS